MAEEARNEVRLLSLSEWVGLWRNVGLKYRLSLLLILVGLLAFIPSGVALGMLMNGQSPGAFGWWALAIYGVGLVLIVLGNLIRVREIRRYRELTGT